MADLDAKLDALATQMHEYHTAVCERLTKLETAYDVSKTNWTRGVTVLGSFLTIAINAILAIFRKH